MEIEFLYIIAEVSIALAGFSGVVFILGQRSKGEFSVSERNGLYHLLFTTCGNMLVALVVAAIVVFSDNDLIAWRIGCGVMGLFVIAGSSRAVVEERRGEHSLPKALAWAVPIVAIALAAVNVLVALGLFEQFASVSFISLSIYLLFVALAYFVSLLVPEVTTKGA